MAQQATATPQPLSPGILVNPTLTQRLFQTRRTSTELTALLSAEDMTVQAMEDASPTKWHLAHVTWFFETFLLKTYLRGYREFDPTFNYCFNSYYETLGPRQPRPNRGLLTRPSAERVMAYRRHVDEALEALLAQRSDAHAEIARLVEIGINHEQQHQELLLTDILALFAANPLRPAYRPASPSKPRAGDDTIGWVEFEGGIRSVGHDGNGFSWDNEGPRHTSSSIPSVSPTVSSPTRNGSSSWRDGGYRTASLWLADGWTLVNREELAGPALLGGDRRRLAADDALRPAGGRARRARVPRLLLRGRRVRSLGRQAAAHRVRMGGRGRRRPGDGQHARQPRAAPASRAACPQRRAAPDVRRRVGVDASAYLPYPGYRPPAGAIGEYNGKFMVGQHVLRGASCATPDGHSRATYRNFFYPHQRWQFIGLRLASEID